MAQRTVETIRIELPPEEHLGIRRWAEKEGRSARRHSAILLRKLVTLRKTNPDDLAKLGLLDRSATAIAR